MAATALVAARIDPGLKEEAEKVLRAEGVTPFQTLRRVYEYVVVMGEVPEFSWSCLLGSSRMPHALSRRGESSRN